MREVICANIGQAGIQIGNAVWELLCSEHGVDSCGTQKSNDVSSLENTRTFFCPVSDEQYVPRSISVDLENTVIDEVRSGSYRNLFHPEMLISGPEDSSNNFARGHFTIGKRIVGRVMNQIRKIVHTCDMLHGFFITSAIGGGTGSGFQTLLMESLSVEYSKYTKVVLTVFPSNTMSTSTVEPYNAILDSHFTIDTKDMSINFDNQSSYKICYNNLDIQKPTYSNINRIIAYLVSNMTVSMRYESTLNSDLCQIVTNLVPFPHIHFPILNSAPIISESRASHETYGITEMTKMLFSPLNQMIGVDPMSGNYFACCIQYRGSATPRLANEAIVEIKRQNDINFVDWCPTGFKVGINRQPPISIPSSSIAQTNSCASMLANSSAIAQIWKSLGRKFDHLYDKRAFVHWYVGEGMEEGEFTEAKDTLSLLITDHADIDNEKDAEQMADDFKKEQNQDLEESFVSPPGNYDEEEQEQEQYDEEEMDQGQTEVNYVEESEVPIEQTNLNKPLIENKASDSSKSKTTSLKISSKQTDSNKNDSRVKSSSSDKKTSTTKPNLDDYLSDDEVPA